MKVEWVMQRKIDRKTLQLCSQVADTLNQVLAGECDDDVLRELQVLSVVPAPDATQLMVIVAPAFAEGRKYAEVLCRLAEASKLLRAEVAAAITRRRAPKLLFQYIDSPTGYRDESA